MSDPDKEETPPRLRRTLELVYSVDGVVAARVWQWTENLGRDERVAVAVRANATSSPTDVLRRVEAAVEAIREPGEAWEFGLLDHALSTRHRFAGDARANSRIRPPRSERAPHLPVERASLRMQLQFETKIASISVLTCSSVCLRAIAISLTMSVRAVSSMRRSPNLSCLSVFRR